MKNSLRTDALLERWFDIAGALTVLILLSPVWLMVALLILALDGQPIIFRQHRIGRGGKPFLILKFRTMRFGHGGVITAAGDARVTRLGARLRKLKLDELPQMINVLKGDMSLIGPRPEVPEYVDLEDNLWRTVLEVRPGVTDLASLVYRDEEKILGPAADVDAYYRNELLPMKLRLSVQYRHSRSWRRDLKLLWLTARCSFLPQRLDGARTASLVSLAGSDAYDV